MERGSSTTTSSSFENLSATGLSTITGITGAPFVRTVKLPSLPFGVGVILVGVGEVAAASALRLDDAIESLVVVEFEASREGTVAEDEMDSSSCANESVRLWNAEMILSSTLSVLSTNGGGGWSVGGVREIAGGDEETGGTGVVSRWISRGRGVFVPLPASTEVCRE